jgi:hypothetical protein
MDSRPLRRRGDEHNLRLERLSEAHDIATWRNIGHGESLGAQEGRTRGTEDLMLVDDQDAERARPGSVARGLHAHNLALRTGARISEPTSLERRRSGARWQTVAH